MSHVNTFQDASVVEFYRSKIEKMTAVGAAELLRVSGLGSASTSAPSNASTPSSGDKLRLLDNASGAGIVASLLLSDEHGHTGFNKRSDVFVQATDDSAGMCEHITKRAEAEGWAKDAYNVVKADSQDLSPLTDDYFDYTITSYGVFLFQDPMKGLKEIVRVTKPGGTMAFNTWTRLFWMATLEAAAPHIPFPVMQAPTIQAFKKWESIDFARSQAEEAGFKDVRTSTIDWDVPQQSPEEFVNGITPLLPGITGAGQDADKVNAVKEALLKVAKEQHGDGPFTLKAGSGFFVGTK